MSRLATPTVSEVTHSSRTSRRRWWTLAAASVATFLILLDFSVVNLALPAIQRDIGGSFTDLRWIVDAYAVSMAALILVAGSVADRVGHRRVFLFGVSVFAIASLMCGLAHQPVVLNAARAVQGLGAAAMLASAVALLGVTFEGRERQLSLAVWSTVSGTAIALGPLVGGIIVEYLGWHWIFFVNLPICIVLVIFAFMSIGGSHPKRRGSFDWPGALVLPMGLGALVFALLRGNSEGWGSATIMALLGAATALLAAFVIIERSAAQPILDLKLFRTPEMAGASLAAFAIGLTVFSSLLFLSLYLQDILQYAPLAAGLRLLPVTLGAFVASFGTLWLSRSMSSRLIVGVGFGLCGTAFLIVHGLTVRSTWTALPLGFVLAGAGTGLVNTTVAGMALRAGGVTRAGMASALNSGSRLIGLATGVAVLGSIFQHRVEMKLHVLAPELPGRAAEAVSAGVIRPVVAAFPPLLQGAIRYAANDAFISAINQLFLVCAAISAVAGILTVLIVRRETETSTVTETEASTVTALTSVTQEQGL